MQIGLTKILISSFIIYYRKLSTGQKALKIKEKLQKNDVILVHNKKNKIKGIKIYEKKS